MAPPRERFDPTDPAGLHPDQRQREVAAILAAGVIRARPRPSSKSFSVVARGRSAARDAARRCRLIEGRRRTVKCRSACLDREDSHIPDDLDEQAQAVSIDQRSLSTS